ncbi:MAG: SDR family oxidoreductase [Deltaproteobacteria bacterium]|nr:SDR family oxidoreductase [Deltaproteobacteria bacterium]
MKKYQPRIPLSVLSAFEGKTLLVIGASGFLGKVWLSMFLQHVHTFKHLYVIIRPKGKLSARERFDTMIHQSFAFAPWFEKKSFSSIQALLNEHITVLDGDLSVENLGLRKELAKKIQDQLDIMVNVSGLVDFRAPLESAYKINIRGTCNAAEFVAQSDHAKLIHVSTCYVAGQTEGAIVESVSEKTPNHQTLDLDKEIKWIEYSTQKLHEKYKSTEKLQELTDFLRRRNESKGRNQNIKQFQRTLEQFTQKEKTAEMVTLGADRAQALGFPNTYTYSKALAELLLKKNYAHIDVSIFRPAIVESADQYPFPGYNEGFNTSGPLVYLIKGRFRYFPAEEDHPFDVIPVDYVAKALTLVTAAKLKGKAAPVYQIGTSFLNTFTLGEACQLSSDYYEMYYRQTGKTFFEKHWRHRKTIATLQDHVFTSKNLLRFFSSLDRHCKAVDELPQRIQLWLKPLRGKIFLTKRKLEQAENLINLFKPFTRDFVQIYISKNITAFEVKEKFWTYDIDKLNWEEYWIQRQMPGLLKWCFPVIEGKAIPHMQQNKKMVLAEESLPSIELSA